MVRLVRSLGSTRHSVLARLLASALVLSLSIGFGSLSSSPPGSPVSAAQLAATGRARMGGTVVIDNVSGSLWTCGFNPFSTSVNFLSFGIIYEPLIYVNGLNAKETPWLATGYSWGAGNKTLSFTIRKGVKWSDGQAFTPADVVFTFDLLKKFGALDLNAVWSVLSGVSQAGNRVVFRFKQPAVPYFYFIADQTPILPRHIWSKIKNPVTFVDKNPLGTGPFVLGSCSPQNITYTRNAHYWQPGKPYVTQVRYPAFMDNQPGNLYLAEGKANWGGQYIPNVKTYYLNRDPAHRHIWYPPAGADVGLFPNLTAFPTNNLAVREAISCGIDRGQVSRLGVYGYLPPANQSGIVLPNWASWFDKSLDRQRDCGYNPNKAISLLKSAGFVRHPNGMFYTKAGKPLSLSVINVGGYTDWVAEASIIRDSLKKVGIDLKPQNLSGTSHIAQEQAGQFQLSYETESGGPTPYYWFKQLLHSDNTAPIGKTAASNYERFRSHTVDTLLNSYAATTSSSRQHQIIRQMQDVMLSDVPFIPVLEGVNWYQYDTSQITGWPTPTNPYASPAPYNTPDWEVLLMNVHLK